MEFAQINLNAKKNVYTTSFKLNYIKKVESGISIPKVA